MPSHDRSPHYECQLLAPPKSQSCGLVYGEDECHTARISEVDRDDWVFMRYRDWTVASTLPGSRFSSRAKGEVLLPSSIDSLPG